MARQNKTSVSAPQIEMSVKALSSALDLACSVADDKSIAGKTNHVLLDADPDTATVEISATNLIRSVWASRPASVKQGIAVAVHAKHLQKFVSVLAGDGLVSIRLEEKVCTFTQAKRRWSAPILPAADFPSMDKPDASELMPIQRVMLEAIFHGTEHAVMKNPTFAHIAGVLLVAEGNRIEAVSLDGHCIGYVTRTVPEPVESPWKALVPRESIPTISSIMGSVAKDGHVHIGIDGPRFVVHAVDEVFATQMPQGEFPEWRRAVPAGMKYTMKVDRAAMLDMARAISMTSRVEALGAYPGDGTLRLVGKNEDGDDCEDEVAVVLDGPMEPTGMNGVFLRDTVASFDCETVVMQGEMSLDPLKFYPLVPEDDPRHDDFAIMTPLRLPE